MMLGHDLYASEACRALPFLLTTHAALTVQVPADPGFDPLPVGDHEQMADAGQGQGDVQRQPGNRGSE